MAVTVNLRHLEKGNVQLDGEISFEELDMESVDEVIHPDAPVTYNLEVERSGQSLLVGGRLATTLKCECVRCLKSLTHRIELNPYELIVPLEGEEKAPVANDLVDLTPYLREDILLAFPPHPVCESECERLPSLSRSSEDNSGSAQAKDSAWDELNKLKF